MTAALTLLTNKLKQAKEQLPDGGDELRERIADYEEALAILRPGDGKPVNRRMFGPNAGEEMPMPEIAVPHNAPGTLAHLRTLTGDSAPAPDPSLQAEANKAKAAGKRKGAKAGKES